MSQGQRKPIPLSVPVLSGNEAEYLRQCIASGWVSSAGPWVERFEAMFAARIGARNAVSVSSGTAALHLTLLAAGVGADDEVIVPTVTFVATVNAVRYVGATPVFMDCDDHLNLDVDKVQEFLEQECSFNGDNVVNRRSGRVVRAIIPVHVFGHLADVVKLSALARRFNVCVIEDATEALGSRWTEIDRAAGTVGDFGCFSFNGNKILTTGGGGMVVAANQDALAKIKYLSTQARDDDVFFAHDEVGYNYRLSSLHAAVGIAQLEQLDGFVSAKRRIFERYRDLFAEVTNAVSLIEERGGTSSNYWLNVLLLPPTADLRTIISELRAADIEVRPVWKLNHTQKPYRAYQSYRIDNAPRLYARCLSVPSSADIDIGDQRLVVERVLSAARLI